MFLSKYFSRTDSTFFSILEDSVLTDYTKVHGWKKYQKKENQNGQFMTRWKASSSLLTVPVNSLRYPTPPAVAARAVSTWPTVGPPLLLTCPKTPSPSPPTPSHSTPSAASRKPPAVRFHLRAYWAWAEAHCLSFPRPKVSTTPHSLTACPASRLSTSLGRSDLGLLVSPLG